MSFTFDFTGDNPPPPDRFSGQTRHAGWQRESLAEQWKKQIYDELLERLNLSKLIELPAPEAASIIRSTIYALFTELNAPVSLKQRNQMTSEIIDELLGLGPLENLLKDKGISDILVNGADTVYVERHGRLERAPVRFRDDEHLLNVIEKIVSAIGRRIDESSPMVDARLPDGSRMNAVIPPLALDGPLLSIRRVTVDQMSLEHLVDLKTLSWNMMKCLRAMVQLRLNIIISGGTGSGKTTLLNALSGDISNRERIITIEDSAELQLQQAHVARLETRLPNLEGKGEVTARDLVRNSLRMRPDRIILGEIRGTEALDMLTAMNTGHDGSLTTIHANNPKDALHRLNNMIQMSGVSLSSQALGDQIGSAIDVIIHIERQEDGRRRIVSVQELSTQREKTITLTELFRFERSGVDENSHITGDFRATGVVPEFYKHLKVRNIELSRDIFQAGK